MKLSQSNFNLLSPDCYLVRSYLIATVCLIPSCLVWSEIKCKVHVTLRPINQFKPVQQSRQQALRAYCPHIYTVQALWPLLEVFCPKIFRQISILGPNK